ncbi:hypothetical protein D3C81_1992310 [compost metagenome]
MGADPGNQAQCDNDEQRRAPDHQLELGRVIPVRLVFGFGIALAVAPGEQNRQGDDRNNNQQHK